MALLIDLKVRLLRVASIINDKPNDLENPIDETHLSDPTRFQNTLKESFRMLLPGMFTTIQRFLLYTFARKIYSAESTFQQFS